MLQQGFEITAVEYINAHKWRQEIKDAFLKAMADYDALLVPTTILSAPLLDQKMVSIDGNNFEVYSALSRLTTVSAITGLPALNVPAGLVDNKLPAGAQLIGRPFDEGLLLRIAYYYEEYYNIPQYMVPPITL
jgi:aspartyl-tRNA(Asn)/glutamyl-tRNA(Gln) amidotransferase subunit A